MECVPMTETENGGEMLLVSRKSVQPYDVCFRNLSYTVQERSEKTKKCILKSLNGRFKSGRVTVILGPSGAGKSSLLNVLSFSVTRGVTGEISLNNKHNSRKYFKKHSCYIPQEFSLMPLLTARETLMFAADFKLGCRVKTKIKTAMVNEILNFLGLATSAEILVKYLSGGQKKRLLIAEELLSNPSVMFFDEPTSGLDSSSASELLFYLKSLAKDNRTIVCVLHQPSSFMFKMFDDLYVLKDGHFIYGGSASDMVPTFEKYGFVCPQYYNPAEFVFEVIKNSKGIKFQYDSYSDMSSVSDVESNGAMSITESKVNDEYEMKKQLNVSLLAQCIILLKRAVVCAKRDRHVTYFRLIVSTFESFFMGAIWYNFGPDADKVMSNMALFFVLVCAAYATNVLITVMSYPNEAATVRREHRNNRYSPEAYFLSKLISDFMLQVLSATLFVIPMYFLSGQPIEIQRILIVWSIVVLLVILAQTHGLAFGTLFPSEISIFLLIVVAILLAVLSGFAVRINHIAGYIRWFAEINYLKLAFEGMMAAIYGLNRESLDCSEMYCYFKNPRKVLEELYMTDQHLEWTFIGLGIWIFVYQILFYIAVKWRTRNSS